MDSRLSSKRKKADSGAATPIPKRERKTTDRFDGTSPSSGSKKNSSSAEKSRSSKNKKDSGGKSTKSSKKTKRLAEKFINNDPENHLTNNNDYFVSMTNDHIKESLRHGTSYVEMVDKLEEQTPALTVGELESLLSDDPAKFPNGNNGSSSSRSNPSNQIGTLPEFNSINIEENIPKSVILQILKKILPPVATVSDDCLETLQRCVASFISLISSEAGIHAHVSNSNVVLGSDIFSSLESLGFQDFSLIAQKYTEVFRENQMIYDLSRDVNRVIDRPIPKLSDTRDPNLNVSVSKHYSQNAKLARNTMIQFHNAEKSEKRAARLAATSPPPVVAVVKTTASTTPTGKKKYYTKKLREADIAAGRRRS